MDLLPVILCVCGCGRGVRKGSRYIRGHNRQGQKHTDKSRSRMSLIATGRKHSEEHRRKNSEAHKGHKHSEETKRKMSEIQVANKYALGHKHSDEARKKMSKARTGKISPRKGVRLSEETKNKLSEAHKGKKLSEEHKQKVIEKLKGRPVSVNTRRKISKAQLGVKKGPWSEKDKKKLSVIRKQQWSDPEFHKKRSGEMARGSATARPNKPEAELLDLFESIQPGKWKYVGDGSLIIAGKNPDFVNEDKCLLAEMFGNYWHRNDSPRKRANVFKPFGWRTLVVWEHELKNKKQLTNKLSRFCS